MLQISGLTKIYESGSEKVTALNGIDVTFPDRALMVILGKSGCGKTTLINMIGGLDKPTGGSVLVNGTDITKLVGGDFDAYRNTYIGVVFQEFNLIDDITVYENIEMSLKLADKNADVNTVDEVLTMVGLSNLGYRKPGELSGGQRQRVALARTLIKKPEIILADEPTGALDAGTGEEVFESLKKIAETKLVVIVTHNRDLAFTYGDRVLEMTDGRFVSDRKREERESDRTKELNDHLVQLSATAKIDRDSLNGLLARQEKGSEIYLGLSYDKDRIALAYSDVVDSFYEKAETSAYHDTGEVAVTTDRTFALSKGRLRTKDALTMARKNIKRTKKRFALLTVLTTISMMCVIISVILAGLSTFRIVAENTFGRGGQNFVELERYYSDRNLSPDDVAEAQQYFGGETVAGVFRAECRPMFADPADEMNSWQTKFEFKAFNYVVEDVMPDDFGYKLIEGSRKPAAATEIVISDLAAFELCRSGFVGKNAAGETGLYYPGTAAELLGYGFRAENFEHPLTVVGVYETNYGDYRALSGIGYGHPDYEKLSGGFESNREFVYGMIFGAPGLGDSLRKINGTSYRCEIRIGYRSIYLDGLSRYDFVYDPSIGLHSGADGINTYFPVDTLTPAPKPAALGDGEIMISMERLKDCLRSYSEYKFNKQWENESIVDNLKPVALLGDETYNSFMKEDMSLYVYPLNNYGSSVTGDECPIKIVGFYNDAVSGSGASAKRYGFLTAQNVADAVRTDSTVQYDKLIVGRGPSAYVLEGRLKDLYYSVPDPENADEAWRFGSAAAPASSINHLNNTMGILQPVFLIVAGALMVMAFLVIMNFMSQSVRFRLREIAVLRLVGAKRSDIAKIFLTESGIITIRVGIFASILAFICVLILNAILSGMVFYFGLSVTLLGFNFLHVLLMFVITAVFTGISSLAPILGVTMKTPVEAIKLGGI